MSPRATPVLETRATDQDQCRATVSVAVEPLTSSTVVGVRRENVCAPVTSLIVSWSLASLTLATPLGHSQIQHLSLPSHLVHSRFSPASLAPRPIPPSLTRPLVRLVIPCCERVPQGQDVVDIWSDQQLAHTRGLCGQSQDPIAVSRARTVGQSRRVGRIKRGGPWCNLGSKLCEVGFTGRGLALGWAARSTLVKRAPEAAVHGVDT